MKKTLIGILLFSLSFSFLSCGSDDDSLPEDFNPVVGSWLSDIDTELKIIFTEDFREELYIYQPSLPSDWEQVYSKEYSILKKGEITYKPVGITYYKLENSKLYLRSTNGNWSPYSRIPD